MILVLDYGVGNVASIVNMLKRVGAEARTSRGPADVQAASRIVLPGVGSFDAAMRLLSSGGYIEPLRKRVLEDGVPLLGICLGMQLLGRASEEGDEPGLGWLDAVTVRMAGGGVSEGLKIPHMGWNTIRIRRASPFFSQGSEDRFYFVHSFHLRCADERDVLTTTTYGAEFVSTVCRENILATQYHPEKSHRFGRELLKRFSEWNPENGSGR